MEYYSHEKRTMKKELCKKHNVDYAGTRCGHCDNLNKRHSNKLRRIRQVVKDFERTPWRGQFGYYNDMNDVIIQIVYILRRR
jgi:N-glycosylase/DNA lyase